MKKILFFLGLLPCFAAISQETSGRLFRIDNQRVDQFNCIMSHKTNAMSMCGVDLTPSICPARPSLTLSSPVDAISRLANTDSIFFRCNTAKLLGPDFSIEQAPVITPCGLPHLLLTPIVPVRWLPDGL